MKRTALVVAALCAAPAAAQFGGATRSVGAPNLAAGQVSVGTAATLVMPARPTRQDAQVSIGAANNCAVGGPSVTLATGYRLPASVGAALPVGTASAVYVACDAATTVSFFEAY